MTLKYDSFGVRRIEVILNIWPDFDRFHPGELSKLLGMLNDDDAFTSVNLEPESGLRLEGEQWIYDLGLSSLELRAKSFLDIAGVNARVRALVDGTRNFFDKRPPIAFFTDEVRLVGFVPDDKDRNVGEVVQKRLLSKIKQEDRDALPGLEGAGLRLVGTADSGYHWHANIEPPHGAYDSLGLYAQLMFLPPDQPPRPGADCDSIVENVNTAYRLLNEDLLKFATKLFT